MKMCNFCSLKRMKKRAKEEGERVYVRHSKLQLNGQKGGSDVFIVPEGEVLDTSVDARGNHGKHWKAWFAEIPSFCVC